MVWSPGVRKDLQGHLVSLDDKVIPIRVDFDIIAREGAFVDSTIANYTVYGENSNFLKTTLQEVDRKAAEITGSPLRFFTVKFESVSTKTIGFDIIYRADAPDGSNIPGALTPTKIIQNVMHLQSFCYPRLVLAGSPPVALLIVRGLYSVQCFVKSVMVTWTNHWSLNAGNDHKYELTQNPFVQATGGINRGLGLPMGCDISMEVMLADYPTAEYAYNGGTFHSYIGGDYIKTYQGAYDPEADWGFSYS